ncbi:carbohydrate kinase [Rhodocytophaga rosea]|uniref:Carbohydrate kinase n=1 Tax=Rhodocytophaga rosea TaxID=2704465 RepID=A0A6C0GRV6_9BACT|nr:carbohydrate kinase [Rhodocytophaga rosea]QHT70220.1 carbohydrate kinase [Rhodocytophaga rosea]
MSKQIICFGETLFDMLPDGAMPGGAPMNVGIHLTYNGLLPVVISRVGNDEPGKQLLTFLQEKGISTQWIQTDSKYQTGIVQANVSDRTHVTYDIVAPVAWDFITYQEEVAALVKQSDVFVFGSLAARHAVSQETLLKYLAVAPFKVFDVNLRPPHYTPERTQLFLQQANIVKMNHLELAEIVKWHGKQLPEKQAMEYLKTLFNWETLIVTRGENGAAILSRDGYAEHGGFVVNVEDTIGSGDAFLATYISSYLRHQPVAEALEKACKIGAFVATQKGATPFYIPEETELR